MFPEPTSASLAGAAALMSAFTMALFGVDYYSLLYALIGALCALSRSEQMGRGRAVLYVMLSTLIGAVIGNLAAGYLVQQPKWVLFGLCLVGGLTAQAVASAIFRAAPGMTDLVVKAIEAAVKRYTGEKP